jgi:hypothetical protein
MSARALASGGCEQTRTNASRGTRSGRVEDEVAALLRRPRSPLAPSTHAVPGVARQSMERSTLSERL